MHNVIPRFISDRFGPEGNVSGGCLVSPVLYVDIAGFTSMTEELMKQGKHGAEDLSILINRIYGPLIESIYQRGGFITSFAGDAVTALFPDDGGYAALSAAEKIMDGFSRREDTYRKYSGGRDMKARLGLSSGEVRWRVYGDDRKAFCFYGDAMEECAAVTQGREAGRISMAESFTGLISADDGSLLLHEWNGSAGPVGRVRPTVAGRFYPEAVLRTRPGGEFRSVVALFLGLRRGEMTDAGGMVSRILNNAEKYGGYFNGMFFDHKGPHMLVVFGAPVSYENNADRALSMALELREDLGERIRMGMTSGTAFAGIVGSTRRCTYTVLGDCVNTAARLMQNTEWGSVCLPEASSGMFSRKLLTGDPREMSIKGKSLPLKVIDVVDVTDMSGGRGFRGALVGREKEMARLEECLQPLAEGSFAGFTCVYGEAGVGKSRLLADLAARLPRYQSFRMQTDGVLKKSLNPFVHMLKEYFGQVEVPRETSGKEVFDGTWDRLMQVLEGLPERDTAEPVIGELKRTRSLLAAMLGYFSEDSLHRQLDARGRFDNTLMALKAFFKAQSLIAPSIFLLEDLHWLDADSSSALEAITRNVDDFPFAVVASSRFFDDGSRPGPDLHDTVTARQLTLDPLEGLEALALAEDRLSFRLSDELSTFMMQRTQGNPFYIEQFCMYLDENAFLEERSGRLYLCEDETEIPESIGSIIVARIDRLSGKLKKLVQTAAVLGREFDVQVLSAMLRGDREILDALLEQGEKEAIWSALSEILYIFSHTMLREVAYEMQLRRQLQELHGLAAGSMEELYGSSSSRHADIAFHYEKAGIGEKAAEYLRKAADFAIGEYRNQEAADLLGRLLRYRKNIEDRIGTELEMLNLLVMMGKWSDAEEIIKRNRKAASENSLAESYADCCRHHAALEHRRGNNEEARRHLEEAWEHYSRNCIETGMMKCRSVRASISMILGDFDSARKDLEESMIGAEARGDLESLARNTSDLGNVNLYQYRLDEAEENFSRAGEICRKTGDMRTEANIVNNLGVIEYYRRNYGKCRSYLDRYLEMAEKVGDRESMTYVLGNIGVMHQENGDLEEAMSYYTRQLAMARELGIIYSLAFAKRQIGHVHWVRGEYERALDWMMRSLEIAEDSGDPRNRALATRDIGKVYFETGELERSRDYLEMTVEISKDVDKEVHVNSLFFLARLSMKQERPKEAAEHVESLIAVRREMGEELLLLDSLIDCAEIMLFTGYEDRAQEMLEESRELAGRTDSAEMLWYLELEESLLQALSDPSGAEERLLLLLEEHGLGEKFSARINFHLYRITGGEDYRKSAAEIYRKLYEKVPEDDFREKLEILGRD